MRKRELKNMEWGLVIVAIILTIIGLVALFSATQETEYDEFKKQIIWFVVSIVAMILTMLINYETLVKISPVLYGIFLILLVAVMFTTPVNGATSWFNIGGFSFQPSEFAKVAVILFLTFIISKIQERYKDEINKAINNIDSISSTIIINNKTTRLWNCNGILCSNMYDAIYSGN